ncbi:FAD-binding oxidoreductase [Isoptericola variabilis]|uniref:Oxidoreductase FAD-binding domain protein n=1 Tax=Isoptericola variabilis (strain 225) TaxID=743718 RepID=F6FVY0_ISOV2|nr:FAD-binding oxidoreductase [Isoptericola variabilis]AEG44450.1 Oxidoreductase FAD-binding domain protein [Isoptericola variabilis 225]TWH28278.1 ferredoxin-NADP reductase [Isoptericola variabilis J7]
MSGTWHVGTVVDAPRVTRTARAITLEVPGFGGALAGQHVDLRLTAADGYQAVRSYSLSDVGTDERVDVLVDRVPGGEVSTYLVDDLQVGDRMEVRGPLGGYFVWRPDDAGPVLLVAGGSGLAPLLAMLRARRRSGSRAPFRLVHSVRTPDDVLFPDELGDGTPGVTVTLVHTRTAPAGSPRPAGRIVKDDLTAPGFDPADAPTVYVCGSTGFVEAAATLLTELGHDPARVRTERFGGA